MVPSKPAQRQTPDAISSAVDLATWVLKQQSQVSTKSELSHFILLESVNPFETLQLNSAATVNWIAVILWHEAEEPYWY